MRTVIVTAFVDSDLFTLFPGKERIMAIRAEEIGNAVLTESLVNLKQIFTDLASELRPLDAVVIVDIGARSVAARTGG